MKKKFFSSFLIALLLLVNFAPSAFALQDPPVDFTKKGSITVHKYSFEGNTEKGTGLKDVDIPDEATALPDTVYEIQRTHELVQGTNKQEKWVKLETLPEPIKITTDKNGVAKFGDLDLGRYTLKEISAPGHLIDTATYTIDVPLRVENGTKLLYDVHVYPKNTPVQGSVEFLNIGEDADKNKLPGVTFHLFKEDGTRVDVDVVYPSGPDGKVKVEGLAPGSYYFQEVETVDGYLLNNTKIEFEIEEVTGDEQPEPVVLDDFPNYKEPDVFAEQRDLNERDWRDATTTLVGETVEFRLSTTAPTDIDEYVEFALSDQIDSRLNYTAGSTKVYINDLKTTLVEGDDYTLTEGTEANKRKLKVSLTEEGIAKLTAEDTLYVEFSAVVNKTALGEEPIEIENTAIVNWNNNKGAEGGKESDPTETTPKEGTLTITKVAKNDNGLKLEGAKFKLQRLENDVWLDVGPIQTTGETGELTWNLLVSGKYRLVETKAPAGYNLLANPIEFTIDDGVNDDSDANLTHNFQVENMPVGSIPQTGGMGTLLFTVSGLLLMGFAGFNLMIKRQEAK